jgi:hypothetical protein
MKIGAHKNIGISFRVLLCWLIGVASALGQTSTELASKYSQVPAYEIRPGILMTARYAEDGQVCEMVIEKRHETPAKTDLSSAIPRQVVKQLIDELVPPAERGKPSKPYFKEDAESTISGGVEDRESDFENVSIKVVGSVSQSCDSGDEVIVIRWKKRACGASKTVGSALRKSSNQIKRKASSKEASTVAATH